MFENEMWVEHGTVAYYMLDKNWVTWRIEVFSGRKMALMKYVRGF